jgi:hypothetical protein
MYYLLGQKHFKTMVVILLMMITCYAILAYQRNKVWQDDISLWDDVSQKSPHKVRSYCNLGLDYAAFAMINRASSFKLFLILQKSLS